MQIPPEVYITVYLHLLSPPQYIATHQSYQRRTWLPIHIYLHAFLPSIPGEVYRNSRWVRLRWAFDVAIARSTVTNTSPLPPAVTRQPQGIKRAISGVKNVSMRAAVGKARASNHLRCAVTSSLVAPAAPVAHGCLEHSSPSLIVKTFR